MKFDPSSDVLNHVYGKFSKENDSKSEIKQILLLTTAIFLLTAPSPNAQDIGGMTANFLAPSASELAATSSAED
jgi:hypothetical protein